MVTIIVELMGGLGLFLAGMNMMSHGIEKVAGSKLRSILEAFTKNRFLGLLVGLFFTAVIQSSSAATSMAVSFVNSGLMNLSQASGIILGANIGTTVTALLVAFKLSAVAPIFVLVGAIMCNFFKEPMVKKSGEIVLGFGILFMGISAMSSAMGQLRDMQFVIDFLANFTNPILGVLLGLVITSVVQSSSVTVSILVVMASQGLVDLRICMFVILGCNIGACTSALLTAFSGGKNAKRTALIHLLFNVFGTVLMFVLLLVAGDFIENIIIAIAGGGTDSGTLGRQIAYTHFLFKVFQVIVFYPFMNWIIKLTYVIVPGEDGVPKESENQFVSHFISDTLPDPTVAVYVAVKEMERMAYMAFNNLNLAVDCLIDVDEDGANQVFETEKYINYLNTEINNYLIKINQNAIPLGDANKIAAYFHVNGDIERIGDHARDIAEMIPTFKERNLSFSKQSIEELKEMMGAVNVTLEESLKMFVSGDESYMDSILKNEEKIDRYEKVLQDAHIDRLKHGVCSARAGVYFADVISSLERVGDHATNIAFALRKTEADGQKGD
ncbi:Na/Pi cotransporter family protein [Floccifex sp.]|uniref:Na/Pi cotransporter family protein n=1 Tax=Floccifex sp. TaxID=2815810 RepID=UPI002A75EFE3|nr:Na/Pi cotransporter family protein [Floccifex sp.]MDD7280490.1 Na/Pi cotransporter family protein [Erysipelotrichaceae bacterium]MDY2958556.1 Na/Pi cotransporter family protein [Floccifex sp.]